MLRHKPTKAQLLLNPSAWTVILRIKPSKSHVWVPTVMSGGELYNGLGALAARPSRPIAIFADYHQAYRAVINSVKQSKRRMLRKHMTRSDWPDQITNHRSAWSIVPVALHK